MACCCLAAASLSLLAFFSQFNEELENSNDLLEAVFLAYAALLSSDEDMRKLVANSNLMRCLNDGLTNTTAEVM